MAGGRRYARLVSDHARRMDAGFAECVCGAHESRCRTGWNCSQSGSSRNMPSMILREADPYWINLAGEREISERREKNSCGPARRDGYRAHLSLLERREGIEAVDHGRVGSAVHFFGTKRTTACCTPRMRESARTASVQREAGWVREAEARQSGGLAFPFRRRTEARIISTPVSTLKSPRRTTLHAGDGTELGVYREAETSEFEILPI